MEKVCRFGSSFDFLNSTLHFIFLHRERRLPTSQVSGHSLGLGHSLMFWKVTTFQFLFISRIMTKLRQTFANVNCPDVSIPRKFQSLFLFQNIIDLTDFYLNLRAYSFCFAHSLCVFSRQAELAKRIADLERREREVQAGGQIINYEHLLVCTIFGRKQDWILCPGRLKVRTMRFLRSGKKPCGSVRRLMPWINQGHRMIGF